jgi:hypothetical protein
MDEYEATFEIASKNDARAVERLLNRLYDTLREESRTVRSGTGDSTEMLEQFECLRDAAGQQKPGTLKVVFEQQGRSFEEKQ